MSVADNLPYFQEVCKLITAGGIGGLVFLMWVISYNEPAKAYVAADNLIMVCMVIVVFSGSLWLMLDMDKHTDVDLRQRL